MEKPLRPATTGIIDACLVVEDDSIILLDLEETLKDFGWPRVHAAATLEAATNIMASSDIRFAVLDFELGHGNTIQLAEELTARGIPALFLTAHGRSVELPAGIAHLEVLSKPFSPELLAEAMRRELARRKPPG